MFTLATLVVYPAVLHSAFAALRVRSTNWRWLTGPSSLLSIVLPIYFGP